MFENSHEYIADVCDRIRNIIFLGCQVIIVLQVLTFWIWLEIRVMPCDQSL